MPKNTTNPDYNWKWHNFVVDLMNGQDRYLAYCRAYDIDPEDKKAYDGACANASRLIRNDKFQDFWTEYLESIGFNNAQVDARLLELIKSEDESVSLRAIEQYNKLRARIINKQDITSDGQPINVTIEGSYAKEPKFRKDNTPTETS